MILNCRQALSRADLARQLGYSRARGNQVLQILTLAPEAIRLIDQLKDPLYRMIVSERFLLSILNLDECDQKRIVEKQVQTHVHKTPERPETLE